MHLLFDLDGTLVDSFPGISRSINQTLTTVGREPVPEAQLLQFVGKRLTVMAPVEKLVVCTPHEQRFYSCDDGPMGPMKLPFNGPHEVRAIGATSSAAPIVTSLVALIYSARPTLDARSVVKIIQQGCDDIGEKGHDIHTGYGRVNFGKTLILARDWGGHASDQ